MAVDVARELRSRPSGRGSSIGRLPPLKRWTARKLQREHWRRTAAEQARQAREHGEVGIAEAFERAAALCMSLPIGRKGVGGTGRRAEAIRLAHEGVHYRDAAARVGVSCSTIRRWWAEAGLWRPLTHAERSAIQAEGLRRRWAAQRAPQG